MGNVPAMKTKHLAAVAAVVEEKADKRVKIPAAAILTAANKLFDFEKPDIIEDNKHGKILNVKGCPCRCTDSLFYKMDTFFQKMGLFEKDMKK